MSMANSVRSTSPRLLRELAVQDVDEYNRSQGLMDRISAIIVQLLQAITKG